MYIQHRGERGSVDVLGWHGAWRALVAIEVKTRLCDFGDLLSTMDRKGRFAPEHARLLGWRPLRFGNILVLPEATRARRTIGSSDAVFDAALPARTIEVRRWLQKPDGDLHGIWLLSNSSAGNANWGPGATPRARRPREGPDETNPATADWALGG